LRWPEVECQLVDLAVVNPLRRPHSRHEDAT
jgi:hypothetical protein